MKVIFCLSVLILAASADVSHNFNFTSLNARVEVNYVSKAESRGFSTSVFFNDEDLKLALFTNDALSSDVKMLKEPNGVLIFDETGKKVQYDVAVEESKFVELRVTHQVRGKEPIRACFSLANSGFWYGGMEQMDQQFFPINEQSYDETSYITRNANSVAERYWLSSNGIYLFVDPDVPLFITQKPHESVCLEARASTPYNESVHNFKLKYRIGIALDPREAHSRATFYRLRRPPRMPDLLMAELPIWSTWARYGKDINDSVVRNFASEIRQNGFQGSQIEIDDMWETCYGSLTVDKTKFPDMRALVEFLHQLGFRVTVWVHPFTNDDCHPWYGKARAAGYFVANTTGNVETQWWNSEDYRAAYLDFTNDAARKWFVKRLTALKEAYGFDGFKFDAGETTWAPPNPVLRGPARLSPGILTTQYIRTVAQFGEISEVRAGWRNQREPIYMRMLDRQSTFSLQENGLASVVTTLLQLNMVGYPFVLPDMVGGNGYLPFGRPDSELFQRWLQANVFMPSIQFSYVPWDYKDVETSRQMVDLHIRYFPAIYRAMEEAVELGFPVNRPIWWIDPKDHVALGIGDEFLLGDSILVAPVLKKGARERRVYLPFGRWKDGNSATIFNGPRWVNYSAPINVLPFFEFQK